MAIDKNKLIAAIRRKAQELGREDILEQLPKSYGVGGEYEMRPPAQRPIGVDVSGSLSMSEFINKFPELVRSARDVASGYGRGLIPYGREFIPVAKDADPIAVEMGQVGGAFAQAVPALKFLGWTTQGLPKLARAGVGAVQGMAEYAASPWGKDATLAELGVSAAGGGIVGALLRRIKQAPKITTAVEKAIEREKMGLRVPGTAKVTQQSILRGQPVSGRVLTEFPTKAQRLLQKQRIPLPAKLPAKGILDPNINRAWQRKLSLPSRQVKGRKFTKGVQRGAMEVVNVYFDEAGNLILDTPKLANRYTVIKP